MVFLFDNPHKRMHTGNSGLIYNIIESHFPV